MFLLSIRSEPFRFRLGPEVSTTGRDVRICTFPLTPSLSRGSDICLLSIVLREHTYMWRVFMQRTDVVQCRTSLARHLEKKVFSSFPPFLWRYFCFFGCCKLMEVAGINFRIIGKVLWAMWVENSAQIFLICFLQLVFFPAAQFASKPTQKPGKSCWPWQSHAFGQTSCNSSWWGVCFLGLTERKNSL